ncbi:MAG: hypothetical protein PHF37_10665 [Phycisphaerae bacterium]|nr:hypothetical protein [Phycisphaerae bacterium]
MARMIKIVLVLALLNVITGCKTPNSGESQLLLIPKQAPAQIEITPDMGEADLIEQMAVNRRAYRESLQTLVGYYNSTGNNMKLSWAQKELSALNDIPQYKYIIEAVIAGPELKATEDILEANYMYDDAYRTEKEAKSLLVYVDEELLRLSLAKYDKLIRKHPSSDKIDDAAYRAAGIFEYFKDYAIALIYYQRAYQWNPETTVPARYKAARILDSQMARRDEALELYREALAKEKLNGDQTVYVNRRIKDLTGMGNSLQEK